VTAEVPFSDLAYASGSSKKLDLTQLKSVALGVVRGANATGDASGSIIFDSLEYLTPAVQSYAAGKVLTTFSVPVNPISPDGSGLKNKAQFVFQLKNSAVVKLEIFTPKGQSVYYYDNAFTADGLQHTIEWDASDKSGKRVSNGVYLYCFAAEGYDGQKDRFINVLGVVR
jgi:hypothetical protein